MRPNLTKPEQGNLDLEPWKGSPVGVPWEVCQHFERLALEVLDLGFKRYSADALLHRIRWHWQVERGDRGFKINNNYAAPLARWFLARNPQAAGFFELRDRVDA